MTGTNEKLYKVLGKNGEPLHGGGVCWFLPENGEPGAWMPKIYGRLVPCRNGYHLIERNQFSRWANWFSHVFEAEYSGEIKADKSGGRPKFVVRQARLIKEIANPFVLTYPTSGTTQYTVTTATS